MAAAKKLTETMIAKAQLAAAEAEHALGQRRHRLRPARAAGRLQDVLIQVSPGRRHEGSVWRGDQPHVRMGPWPSVSLTAARKIAKGYAGAVARGDDPAAEKQEERRRASSTLRQLLAENGNTNATSCAVTSSTARHKDVAAITRADFVTAIAAIEDQGKRGAAADLRKCARTFCEWAVHRGFAPAATLLGAREGAAVIPLRG